jgi:hypothetical protein
MLASERGDDIAELLHARGEAERARGAGVEEDGDARERLGRKSPAGAWSLTARV